MSRVSFMPARDIFFSVSFRFYFPNSFCFSLLFSELFLENYADTLCVERVAGEVSVV